MGHPRGEENHVWVVVAPEGVVAISERELGSAARHSQISRGNCILGKDFFNQAMATTPSVVTTVHTEVLPVTMGI